MMKIKETGFGNVMASLRNIADRVPKHASEQMRLSAQRIVDKAKLQVPELTGDLKSTIRIAPKTTGRRGRLQLDVVAGGLAPSGFDTTRYAARIHENYEAQGQPGARTLAKMAANPGIVIGSGYLSRAVDEEAPKMIRKMIEGTTDIIDEEEK